MTEAVMRGTRQTPNEISQWTCPHGHYAGDGCAECYRALAEADPAAPLWEVSAWFTTTWQIPIRALKDIHHHGCRFVLHQPSTPLVYVLSGEVRAEHGVQAVAGLVGFLLQNLHIVEEFTVTEFRAAHS